MPSAPGPRPVLALWLAVLLTACASAPASDEATSTPKPPDSDASSDAGAAGAPAAADDSSHWRANASTIVDRLAAVSDMPPYGDTDESKQAAVAARMRIANKTARPAWVDKTVWHEQDAAGNQIIFAVGLADKVEDPFLALVTAENRARVEVVRTRNERIARWLRPNGDMMRRIEVHGGTSARVVDWYADGSRVAALAVETTPPPSNAAECTEKDTEACKRLGLTFVGVSTMEMRPYKTNAALCDEGNGWACNAIAWEACYGHADCSDAVLAIAEKAVHLLTAQKSDKLPGAVDTLAWVECLRKNDDIAAKHWKTACDDGVQASCKLACAEVRAKHMTYAVRCEGGEIAACISLAGDACAGDGDCDDDVLKAAQRAVELSGNPTVIDLTAYVHCRRNELALANDAWRRACMAGSKGSCSLSCRIE